MHQTVFETGNTDAVQLNELKRTLFSSEFVEAENNVPLEIDDKCSNQDHCLGLISLTHLRPEKCESLLRFIKQNCLI